MSPHCDDELKYDVLARIVKEYEELFAAGGSILGRKIVEVVGEVLGLAEEQLAPSYDVLRDVGNCSSATVLLVLERLAATVDVSSGEHVVAMAFGPGLTLYMALLRRR